LKAETGRIKGPDILTPFFIFSLWFPNRDRDGRLSVGYYAWLASMALLTWAGFQAAAQVRPAPSAFPQTE